MIINTSNSLRVRSAHGEAGEARKLRLGLGSRRRAWRAPGRARTVFPDSSRKRHVTRVDPARCPPGSAETVSGEVQPRPAPVTPKTSPAPHLQLLSLNARLLAPPASLSSLQRGAARHLGDNKPVGAERGDARLGSVPLLLATSPARCLGRCRGEAIKQLRLAGQGRERASELGLLWNQND